MPEPTPRVLVTTAAEATIDVLREAHGPLMFHQSGGCCDGSSPMCFPAGEFKVGSNDVWLGRIHGCDFFMSSAQFEYWKHTQLTVDVTKGRGASFSLEIPLGVRFLIRSRLFTEQEEQHMAPVYDGEEYPQGSEE
ncbi:DUF779 domain-containing protein [Hymenobacter coalescens]